MSGNCAEWRISGVCLKEVLDLEKSLLSLASFFLMPNLSMQTK